MNKLSVVIITYNEERNIGRCLESLKGISDDIIVVDSGSDDDTEVICREYNVNFITNRFLDYSSQKNFGNSIAKYDFILSIDADEVISPELRSSIFDIKLENNTAYSFNRLNFHSGKPIKHGGWYPDRKIRIWNKKYGEWRGIIHENIYFKELPGIIHIKGDLLHYTYDNLEEHLKQAIKFSMLNAKKDFDNGRKTNFFKIAFAPAFRFISMYVIKLGFLDGYLGYYIAKTTAFASFLRNMELLVLKKKQKMFLK